MRSEYIISVPSDAHNIEYEYKRGGRVYQSHHAKAEPLVRCKDCKYYDDNGRCWTTCEGQKPKADWYCGSAERKEQGE